MGEFDAVEDFVVFGVGLVVEELGDEEFLGFGEVDAVAVALEVLVAVFDDLLEEGGGRGVDGGVGGAARGGGGGGKAAVRERVVVVGGIGVGVIWFSGYGFARMRNRRIRARRRLCWKIAVRMMMPRPLHTLLPSAQHTPWFLNSCLRIRLHHRILIRIMIRTLLEPRRLRVLPHLMQNLAARTMLLSQQTQPLHLQTNPRHNPHHLIHPPFRIMIPLEHPHNLIPLDQLLQPTIVLDGDLCYLVDDTVFVNSMTAVMSLRERSP